MREIIYKHALKNAMDYGKADPKAVLGKVLAEKPELRKKIPEALPLVESIVREVNSLNKDKIEEELGRFEFVEIKGEKGGLQDLPDHENVVLRFAPNPSGPLHIGHSRAALLNDEYAKRYNGKLILRIEDTDPKRVDPEAYDMVREDLEWLDVKWHREVLQSSRLDIYYDHAKRLINLNKAYVCTCTQDGFKELRDRGEACPCRGTSKGENIRRFEEMFGLHEGDRVLRLKTDLEHPNPSIRDFPIMRIVDREHPIVGDKRVYPLMNFSVAVDDHLLGMTHVLRGKDHIINTEKQKLIHDYFGWDTPHYIHYGILKIRGVALSTSRIKKGIEEGEYSGWDDAKLGTLGALRKRGIQAEAIRRAMLDVGIKETDINFSWKNLYAYNRAIIEPRANRYFFVADPRDMIVEDCKDKIVKNKLHPDFPERGFRESKIEAKDGKARLFIARDDFDSFENGDLARLMGAYNIRILRKDEKIIARYHSEDLEIARQRNMKMIHWVAERNIKVRVVTPEEVLTGLGEESLRDVDVGDIIQFERFGFVRIDEKDKEIVAYLAHK